MRVRRFLQAILLLAFAGIFVAGALSISKLWDLGLPCGAAHGCDIVNNHPSSRWFGVPVAYVGFVGYLAIAALAAARAGMASSRARPLALAGYLLSAFGAMTSVGLQIYSLTTIRATCLWCLGSAVIMVLLLVFHALEYSERVTDETPSGVGEFALVTVLAAAVAVSLFGFRASLAKAGSISQVVSEERLSKTKLVPEGAHIFGDKSAPVTVVEFADLMCPTCQQNSPKLKEYVAKQGGKVRLVYRHFPLVQLHKLSMVAAAVSEAAAEKGKFWDFTTAIMATGENIEDPNRIFEIAGSVGLDPDAIRKELEDENGPATQRLTRDINAANALGMTMTPTFLVQVKGEETQAYSYKALMDALENGRYKKYIEGP